MAPKKDSLNAAEEILQAVVVADSFNEYFRPVTLGLPKCLLPIANIPMIEYSLESLAISGVEEIFVVCCSHSEKIKEYISKSRWSKSVLPTVTLVVSQELRSMGDALRDIDAKQLIGSDFILMPADVVSNVNLSGVIEKHRQRKMIDKNSIMTVLCRQTSLNHHTRSKAEESLFVLDSLTNECLKYEAFPRFPSNKKFTIAPSLLKSHPEISIHNDMLDCRIDICSVEVPALFTENFDYQDLRNDFLTGILDSELLGKTVYVEKLHSGYAAHISTPQMYHSISQDIMARWTYPLSPDIFSVEGDVYSHELHNIYKTLNLNMKRSCKLEKSVILGPGTVLGESTKISNSVIGRNCSIGSNVTISNSYILDNTSIGDDCSVTRCMIGYNVILFEKVNLSVGCIIESNVSIGPIIRIGLRTRVSSKKQRDDFSTDEDTDPGSPASDYDTEKLGLKSTGYIFAMEDSFHDDIDNRERGFLDYEELQYERSEAELESEISENDLTAGYETDDPDDWAREVEQTLERAFEDNHTTDIAILELNTLKMAMNITFKDLRQVVLPKILSRIPQVHTKQQFNQIITKWCPVLLKFTHSDMDQIDCLNVITQHLVKSTYLIPEVAFLLKNLYEIDLLEEDPILNWYDSLDESAVGPLKKIKEKAMAFVTWLREAESESDSESN